MEITTLVIFFRKIIPDDRINTSHISIYMVLYHYWFTNQFQNPIRITRSDVMKKAKIHSWATYHKCIRELQALGYIKYNPSYHPVNGSEVHLLKLDENDQAIH